MIAGRFHSGKVDLRLSALIDEPVGSTMTGSVGVSNCKVYYSALGLLLRKSPGVQLPLYSEIYKPPCFLIGKYFSFYPNIDSPYTKSPNELSNMRESFTLS
jgi:hypothetical protein